MAKGDEKTEPKVSVATQLVKLAETSYDLGVTPDGKSYAMPRHGPPIVRQLRGGRQSLRAGLAAGFFEAAGSAASSSALADALLVIEGQAQKLDPVALHLRVAEHNGSLVLDLGDATGRCVTVTAQGWQIVDTPPVRFRRTALTAPLPVPVGGGDFTELWNAVNVAKKYHPVALAVLVCELMPGMPHPVVLLTGEHGTAKSTTTARLTSITDPSTVQLRKAPRDADSWVLAAAGSWCVGLDNLSDIPDWLSDSLCRASTGDGDVRRMLYADDDLSIIAFRRCVFVNGIDPGATNGDLADRLVHLGLKRISAADRRKDEELAAEWRQVHPRVLGSLLDLTVRVLEVLPSIEIAQLPRMADFGLVLAAVDKLLGTDGLSTYYGLHDEMAQDAATSDPVLIQLGQSIHMEWNGTSAELLARITPALSDDCKTWKPPKGWPETARKLTTLLARQAPTLRRLGWVVTKHDRDEDRSKVVRWTLVPPVDEPPKGDEEQSREEKDAAHAADAANEPSSQVNGHAHGAASRAATVRHPLDDAADAASDLGRRSHAADDAAPDAPYLSSTNGHVAASAASAASSPSDLGSRGDGRG